MQASKDDDGSDTITHSSAPIRSIPSSPPISPLETPSGAKAAVSVIHANESAGTAQERIERILCEATLDEPAGEHPNGRPTLKGVMQDSTHAKHPNATLNDSARANLPGQTELSIDVLVAPLSELPIDEFEDMDKLLDGQMGMNDFILINLKQKTLKQKEDENESEHDADPCTHFDTVDGCSSHELFTSVAVFIPFSIILL